MILSRRAALGASGLAALGVLSGCGRPDPIDQLRIAGGEPDGVYIRFGRQLSALARDAGIARTAPVLQTDGSAENLTLLQAGKVELAMSLADSAEPFDGLTAIGRVYQNYLQFVVRADAPYRTVDDLRGRRMSIGASGSGTAITARRTLRALGLSRPSDGRPAVDAMELNLADAVERLRAGDLAALAFGSGIPTPAFSKADMDLRLLDLTAAFEPLTEQHPSGYALAPVPAGTYAMRAPITTIGVANLLLTTSDLPEGIAERLVRLLVDRAADLIPSESTGLQFLTIPNLVETAPLPLHPGAIRAYRDLYG